MATPSESGAPVSFREIWSDAIHYWEWLRIAYNLALALVVVGCFARKWPYFRGQFNLEHVLALLVLAVLANICYCAAYLADIPIQYSSYRATWRGGRWIAWLAGTLFAVALAYYWVVDEIYPSVGA
ncbi:hypothetical protein [Dokdonella soli]|uniref:Uncharacterized protein n=1 Tax=Dokdonella soli TaxID=529810 RepID=A0ABN1IT33_9GAMM